MTSFKYHINYSMSFIGVNLDKWNHINRMKKYHIFCWCFQVYEVAKHSRLSSHVYFNPLLPLQLLKHLLHCPNPNILILRQNHKFFRQLPNRFNLVFVQLSKKAWASCEFVGCEWNSWTVLLLRRYSRLCRRRIVHLDVRVRVVFELFLLRYTFLILRRGFRRFFRYSV